MLSKLLEGDFRGLMAKIMSCNSKKYISGKRFNEINLDLIVVTIDSKFSGTENILYIHVVAIVPE